MKLLNIEVVEDANCAVASESYFKSTWRTFWYRKGSFDRINKTLVQLENNLIEFTKQHRDCTWIVTFRHLKKDYICKAKYGKILELKRA